MQSLSSRWQTVATTQMEALFPLVQCSLRELQQQTGVEKNDRLIRKITTLASVCSFSVSMAAAAIAKQRRTHSA